MMLGAHISTVGSLPRGSGTEASFVSSDAERDTISSFWMATGAGDYEGLTLILAASSGEHWTGSGWIIPTATVPPWPEALTE